MNYFKQVLTVTLWEYRRFYKLKNELIGIAVGLGIFGLSYSFSNYASEKASEKTNISVLENIDPELKELLSESFFLHSIAHEDKDLHLSNISDNKEGNLLAESEEGFVLYSWKKPSQMALLQNLLNSYKQHNAKEELNITDEDLQYIFSPAQIKEEYFYESGQKGSQYQAYIFAGLMILAVFLSFAYQFTGITGEKQLKITEQIVSAIKPQVWMDGKILGITLTGLSSVLTYSIIGIIGVLIYLQFTGGDFSGLFSIIYLPAIAIFLIFTILGVMMWNSIMAAIASVITDPNNSGKSSLMMLPVLFVVVSFLVMSDPDNHVAVFLSWFPLTSATAMPIRWVVTDVHWLQLAGSFIVLVFMFYLLRKLAAKIFHVSILISGKEPSWAEVIKLVRAK